MGNENAFNQRIPDSASQFEKLLKAILGDSFDVIIDKFETEVKDVVIVYIDGMVSRDLVDRDVIKPLKHKGYDGVLKRALYSSLEEVKDLKGVLDKVLEGNAVVMQDGEAVAYSLEFKQWDKRNVSEPDAESVTRGPKEGFTENIQTNTSLLRRKLRTPNLVIEKMILGRQTNTLIAIAYLKDIVNQDVLTRVKDKLNKIDTDCILETGQIEEYIEDSPFSLVSGIGLTQKPDKTASKILEGRVALLCDGTPHALTIPELFIENVHTSEDYYERSIFSTLMRIIRLFALMIAILLPGMAVAVLTYNQEMLPFVFLNTYIASTEKTPLPESAEIFFLIIMFELIKEGSRRLPKTIGNAITFVGALIIGEAAVNAGIVGAPSVIIVALTAVAGLLIVNLNEFISIYRMVFLIAGSTMGLVGISSAIIIMLVHLISIESFGVPILSGFSKEELKDNVMRFPLKKLKFRPSSIAKNNVKRNNFETDGAKNA